MNTGFLVRGTTVATVAALLMIGLCGTASAADAPPPPPDASSLPPDKVAVVSPAMSAMLWGSTVFVNIGCAIGTSEMASTMAGVKADDSAGLGGAATNGCAQFASTGGQTILQGMKAIQPLAVVNPYVNPGIDGFSAAVANFGRSNDQTLTPFGPTVQTFANSINFFKGTSPK